MCQELFTAAKEKQKNLEEKAGGHKTKQREPNQRERQHKQVKQLPSITADTAQGLFTLQRDLHSLHTYTLEAAKEIGELKQKNPLYFLSTLLKGRDEMDACTSCLLCKA